MFMLFALSGRERTGVRSSGETAAECDHIVDFTLSSQRIFLYVYVCVCLYECSRGGGLLHVGRSNCKGCATASVCNDGLVLRYCGAVVWCVAFCLPPCRRSWFSRSSFPHGDRHFDAQSNRERPECGVVKSIVSVCMCVCRLVMFVGSRIRFH